jgi:adenylate cyclase
VDSTRRLAAVMFTDLEGYTPLAHSDEVGALALLDAQDRLVDPLLDAHRGRKIKSTGDGILVEFANARDAVECGMAIQRAAREYNTRVGSPPLRLRVGLHLGDVERRGVDIFGDAVNIASRIEALAEPGEVWVSAQVYDQVQHKVPFGLQPIGPRLLKGIREPIQVYRVVEQARGAARVSDTFTPRLAVLPLTNISPDPGDEYFAEGLTDELIAVLSQIGGLRVISRTSVNQYKSTTKPVGQIGSELGVASILEGSVRKAGDQLRITVQLIDTRTQEHRWSKTFDRRLENVFAIQAEVAERTAGALKIELLKTERAEIRAQPTSSLVAYECYLRGIQATRRLLEETSGAGDREAVNFFEQAIREDPEFSEAYSHLANHLISSVSTVRPAAEVVGRARELVDKALALDPNSSDAHLARGNLALQVELDWARAEVELQQAIALNPSYSSARYWYGFLLHVLQRFGESKRQHLAAAQLDPLWVLPQLGLVTVHEDLGEWEAATALCEQLLGRFSDYRYVRSELSALYALFGRGDEALRLMESWSGSSAHASRRRRAWTLALMGRTDEMLQFLSDWEAGRLPEYESADRVARYYSVLGQAGKALDLLEKDFEEGNRGLWVNYSMVPFDPIRQDPRFVALLKRMDLPTTLSRPLVLFPRPTQK